MMHIRWRDYKIGDRLIYRWNDFDGSGEMSVIVTEIHEDHALAEGSGQRLWVGDFNDDMFRKF